jgi:hypothetical protein
LDIEFALDIAGLILKVSNRFDSMPDKPNTGISFITGLVTSGTFGERRGLTPSKKISVKLDGSDGIEHLTAHSRAHLEGRIEQFTVQVVAEAKAIEQREHAGTGPPEVTAAHIDEAWWVLRRRIRSAKHPILAVVARVFEALGPAGIGVGATGMDARWGRAIFIVSCVATLGAFLLEVHATKQD